MQPKLPYPNCAPGTARDPCPCPDSADRPRAVQHPGRRVDARAAGAGAVISAAALLAKYGLESKALEDTNIMTAEKPVQRMVSKEVLRVKHAPDMNFLETVSHLTFLLSKPNLQFVKGKTTRICPTIWKRMKVHPR